MPQRFHEFQNGSDTAPFSLFRPQFEALAPRKPPPRETASFICVAVLKDSAVFRDFPDVSCCNDIQTTGVIIEPFLLKTANPPKTMIKNNCIQLADTILFFLGHQ